MRSGVLENKDYRTPSKDSHCRHSERRRKELQKTSSTLLHTPEKGKSALAGGFTLAEDSMILSFWLQKKLEFTVRRVSDELAKILQRPSEEIKNRITFNLSKLPNFDHEFLFDEAAVDISLCQKHPNCYADISTVSKDSDEKSSVIGVSYSPPMIKVAFNEKDSKWK